MSNELLAKLKRRRGQSEGEFLLAFKCHKMVWAVLEWI